MKKILITLVALGLALGVYAQTVATTATEGAAVRETSILKDQSAHASQIDRAFTIFRVYDYDVLGGSTAAVDLDPNADWKDIPDNSIITDVIIDIIETVLPLGTNASTLAVGGVTLYSGTTLDDAVAVLVNSGEDAAIGKTTSEDEVAFDAYVAPTSGYFTVTIQGVRGQ